MLQLLPFHQTATSVVHGHLHGTVISEDMTAAKVIFKDKIREVREPLLAAEDVVLMKALEAEH